MKTILYIALGILLGIGAINFAISSVNSLLHLALTACLINGLFACLFGFVAKICFKRI